MLDSAADATRDVSGACVARNVYVADRCSSGQPQDFRVTDNWPAELPITDAEVGILTDFFRDIIAAIAGEPATDLE
jgi:hypothetical protein